MEKDLSDARMNLGRIRKAKYDSSNLLSKKRFNDSTEIQERGKEKVEEGRASTSSISARSGSKNYVSERANAIDSGLTRTPRAAKEEQPLKGPRKFAKSQEILKN
jgi:hypothetical protein